MFSWIPIYTEFAEKLMAYRDRQPELLGMIHDLKKQGLKPIRTEDKDSENRPIPLAEIDPFTFFANFNRGRFNKESRSEMMAWFKEKFDLLSAVPEDFEGIPVVPPFGAWFFPYARKRQADDIPSLWELAKATVSNAPEKLDAKLFDRCLRIRTVGPAKLTMGMFWINPRRYIALDENNRKLFEENAIDSGVRDMSSYLHLIQSVKAKLGEDYPKISRMAWEHANETTDAKKYWAGGFQWGETRKLEEFMEGNFWQIGWDKDDPKTAAKKTWDYFEQVKVGDEFAIKGFGGRNDLVIHYIGEVVHKTTEDGSLKLRRLNRPLYKGKGPKGLTGATWFDTLVPITSQTVIDAIFRGEKSSNQPIEEPNHANLQTRSANLILCGPPGTGKTYQTIERAVKIIDRTFSGDHAACKEKFDQLIREKRIAFITFHQSYSYEDFVEGIRPVLGQKGAEPRYECRAGLFKQLAVNALFDCLQADSAQPTDKVYTDDEKSEIVQRFLAEGDTDQLKPESQWKPYVLVIDEINRGNISKILGELITLIEPDKRVRQSDEQNTLVVTLPYSGDTFAVPGNLFLLATMNTADKSIALVDVALRRRFEFEELPVEFGVCKNLSDKMRLVLGRLNERITLRKDRDHQIGHAYFMSVGDEESFDRTFRLQIIPLLQEYFYNDWDGLRYVLGENLQEEGSFIRKIAGAKDREARNKWQWFFDARIDDLKCLQALSSNYQIE